MVVWLIGSLLIGTLACMTKLEIVGSNRLPVTAVLRPCSPGVMKTDCIHVFHIDSMVQAGECNIAPIVNSLLAV